MITGGLGYTVTQASKYAFNKAGATERSSPFEAPTNDSSLWRPFDSEQTETPEAIDPYDVSGPATSYDLMESPEFFFPALSLLSGAVFAILGAIALAHRWQRF
ncbi:MAG: hypothetical protein KJ645_13565 [Planctomycetes bacterium]|nr:hypothetical protein [Planctomycetota bacterium]